MQSRKTILFVDDEDCVTKSLLRGFLDEPYNCLFAHSGTEALDMIEHHEVHLVITDIYMPGMDGLTLLDIVSQKHPAIMQVVLSGHPLAVHNIRTTGNDHIKLVSKPWNLIQLKDLVCRMLATYNQQLNENQRTRFG